MILKDQHLFEHLQSKGYVLLDAGLAEETAQIAEYVATRFTLPESGFYYSLLSNGLEQNRAIRNTLSGILSSFYAKYFQDYRVISESFLAKPAHTTDELLLHQDWCYTDESRYHAYNIWVPLSDVDESNGAICFLPGSHTWFQNYRSGSLPTGRISMHEAGGGIETVCMRRGQVLLFHPAVFHGSFPNTSGKNRVVATATVMDRQAPFLHYRKENERQVQEFEVDDETILREIEKLALGGIPDGILRRSVSYTHHTVTAADLKAMSTVYDQ